MKGPGMTAAIGRGLVAGAAGTAVITGITMAEAKLHSKEESTAPADAASKLLEIEPRTQRGEQRLANVTHWSYGIAWGVVRGILGGLGLRGAPATFAHFGLVWGTALTVLPAMDIAPPATQWGGKELTLDAFRHFAFSSAVNLAYEAMED
jgi:hypothetical protein